MPKQPSKKSRSNRVDITTVDAVPSNEGNAILDAKFEALLVRMQTPEARRGMEAAFDSSSVELGRAARNAWRRKTSMKRP
jgi:hypothetical protein